MIYFKLVLTSTGRKKALRNPVGAGGRIQQDRVLVTLHQRLSGFDNLVVETKPSMTKTSPDATFLIQDWASTATVVKDEFCSHAFAGSRWIVPDLPLPDGMSHCAVSQVVEKFMAAGAHEAGRLSMGIAWGGGEGCTSLGSGRLHQAHSGRQVDAYI